MFLKCNKRKKDGKEHRYWSIVESVRTSSGRVVQRQVLYLGEINNSQEKAWRKTIELVDEGKTQDQVRQLALFPHDRAAPLDDDAVVQVRLNQFSLQRPRQFGACWLADRLWHMLDLDRFWKKRLPPSRKGTSWLNVLKTFREMYPDLVLGLSDHTPGHATVLGSVALGARMVEKHFTDDVDRVGPDHAFSMDPKSWRDMVDRTRELENALGVGIKQVEENERETVVLQRRAIRLEGDMTAGDVLTRDHLTVLRPCPTDAILPYQLKDIVGKRLRKDMKSGEYLRWTDLE